MDALLEVLDPWLGNPHVMNFVDSQSVEVNARNGGRI